MQNTDPKELRNILTQYFSIKNLQNLCFEMDIPYEDLGGDGRSAKALNLVQYAQRRSRLDELATSMHTEMEKISQQERTAVEQEEILRIVRSIQADVGELLTAVGDTNKKPTISTTQRKELIKLKEMLSNSYNFSELNALCFELNIEYEKLTGNEKLGKIDALIAYAVEEGKLDELTAYIYRTRPHLKSKADKTPPTPKPDNTSPKPVTTIKKQSKTALTQSNEYTELKEQLDKSYSTDNLRTICFDLYIDYEKLTGAEKSGKIDALVACVVEEGKLDELTAYMYRTRPYLKPKPDSAPSKPPAPPNPKPDNTPQKPVVKASKPTNPVKGFLKSLFGNS